ncbi:O-antigen ligase family protein [Aureivirga marina]|uniref:O-antigen ligase family protein n=1 Tax=Aureivirga marina TaxID=1182451 RepID=UPI0018C9324D|nr:O-antigen ligase family protein [Aureivirga marina]
MLSFFKNKKILLLLAHVLLGFIFPIGSLGKLFTASLILYALISIFRTKNKNNEALIWTGYFVGAEVFFRMTNSVLSWELTKYLVIILLTFGMIVEKRKHILSPVYIYVTLLFLIGIAFTKVPYPESIRKAILFNLSGPISLCFSALYCYKRKLSRERVLQFLFFLGLPMIAVVSYLFFKTPSLSEIKFGGASNFDASGGFGPNQVSTTLGVGFFAIGVYLILKKRFSGYLLLDLFLFGYMTFRGMMTFSRGGVLTGVTMLLSFLFFYFLASKNKAKNFLKYSIITIVGVVSLWTYGVIATKGQLFNRYTNRGFKGNVKQDITSGRGDIFENDLQSLYENPIFGIGVGSGKYVRISSGEKVVAAAHNEVSRLLGEHGTIGIIILILLIVVPVIHILKQPLIYKAFLSTFLIFWFMTINHSAMRLAFPGFLYGISLITITEKNEEEDSILWE